MIERRFHDYRASRRVIDVTPGARWRSAVRAALTTALIVVALPLLWLAGSLVLLGLLGAAAATLAWAYARHGWRSWQSSGRDGGTVDLR
ncbi:MAG: hypothetical protein IPP91_00345 [Betaproteobacteria bacterium]|nr:hypothetical protein [Betaproteobacteria bacterium]